MADAHLEAVGEELQLGEKFSVGVEVLESFQTLETHLALLERKYREDVVSVPIWEGSPAAQLAPPTGQTLTLSCRVQPTYFR